MNLLKRISVFIAFVLLLSACQKEADRANADSSEAKQNSQQTSVQPELVSNLFNDSGLSWNRVCGDIPNVQDGYYCIYENSPNPQQTIWFFHGLGDSPEVFENTNERYSSYAYLKRKLGPSRIVMVSFGVSWLLTGYEYRVLKPVHATFKVFQKKIIPFLELRHGLTKPYLLMGHSMGGFTAASLCSAFPELWSKCLLMNPMLPSCDPYRIDVTCNPGPSFVVRYNFSESTWRSHQPLRLLSQAKSLPKTFVTTCKNDVWDLVDGPKAWVDQARRQGFSMTYLPIQSDCDHPHWPEDEVLKFIYSN